MKGTVVTRLLLNFTGSLTPLPTAQIMFLTPDKVNTKTPKERKRSFPLSYQKHQNCQDVACGLVLEPHLKILHLVRRLREFQILVPAQQNVAEQTET
jgi:hypothetical protein